MEEIREGFIRVTSVLQPYADFSAIPEYIMDAAKKRGTEAHDAIETFLNYGYEPDDPYFESFLRWFKIAQPTECIPEQRVYNEEYMLTGRIDLICNLKGDPPGEFSIIDYKTPVVENKSWGLQLACYRLLKNMENKINVKRIISLQIKKEAKMPTVIEYTDEYEKYIDLYLSAYKLHRHFNGG